MRSLKVSSPVACHQKLTPAESNHRKLILLQPHEKLLKNSTLTLLWWFSIWSKLEKLDKRVPHKPTTNQKNHLKCHLLLFYTRMNHFFIGLWWATILIQQAETTSSVVRPRSSSKALPKATLASKERVMVTIWWPAAGLIHYSFLNPGETIPPEKYAQQNDEMHQKLQRLQPALINRKAQFFSVTMPGCTSHNQHFKSWMNWATKFCLICHIHLTSHQLTTTSSSISTTFCRENASTTSRT